MPMLALLGRDGIQNVLAGAQLADEPRSLLGGLQLLGRGGVLGRLRRDGRGVGLGLG